MQLLVLGPGCTKCRQLAEVVDQAARELGLDYQIDKITDLKQILALRVVLTPALVVDGSLKVAGRVPPLEELKRLLSEVRQGGPTAAEPARRTPSLPIQ